MKVWSADNDYVYFETGCAERRRGWYIAEEADQAIGPYSTDALAIAAAEAYVAGTEVPEPDL